MSCDHQSAALDHEAKPGSPSGQRPLVAIRTTRRPPVPLPNVWIIPIVSIRTNGSAQHRIAPGPDIVAEYAEQMQAGLEFPPISVRHDGTDYWPSDRLQRPAAAKLAGFSEIPAEVRPGAKEDAQWDSCAATATHGIRRTAAETEKVIKLALRHPNAAKTSNIRLAKHLHISEPTICRWRKKLSSSRDEDSNGDVRTASRGGTTYELNVGSMARNRQSRRGATRQSLRHDLTVMRQDSTQVTHALLAIIEKWTRGQCGPSDCIRMIEQFLWGHRTEFVKPTAELQAKHAATQEAKMSSHSC